MSSSPTTNMETGTDVGTGGPAEEKGGVTNENIHDAAMKGYCVPSDTGPEEQNENCETSLFGDDSKLSNSQLKTLMMTREACVYPHLKVKQMSLSFSGASVYFISPSRRDGTPMPSSVVKFDTEENVRDEIEKTRVYAALFGLTTPGVLSSHFLEGADSQDPCALMQIDLCGGTFGLPEFASAPPVQTLASVIQSELTDGSHKVDLMPIIIEALERRMCAFTMTSRSVKKVDLSAMYKIVKFVGHGILNRAAEGQKRAKKAPALGAGFFKPQEIDDLDPEGRWMQEVCGRKKTYKAFFKEFVSHESKFTSKFERTVITGLCHNDLHGGNLLLDSQGLVWLIDFATVKDDIHVLMDLTKFLASCLFLYLEDTAKETNVRTFAKLLATTPDATTTLPTVGRNELKEDKVAWMVFDILTRLRFCMCSYEVGDDAPANDGVPFALALFSWSSRMLSYSEPSLLQKGRALYFALVMANRVMLEAGLEVGPTALGWLQEYNSIWEGQKGRRLSTSAWQLQAADFEFDAEFPRYLAQVGTSEAWSTDFISREKVHATEHATTVTVDFAGHFTPRHISVAPTTRAMLNLMRPVSERYMKALLEERCYFGRLLIVGGAGTGKSMLTRQIFSDVSQQQLVNLYNSPGSADTTKTSLLPVRIPLSEWGRMLDADLEIPLSADPFGDLLTRWVENKHGQDSAPHKMITDIRSRTARGGSDRSGSSVGIAEEQVPEGPLSGLLLILDAFDELSGHKSAVLKYLSALLRSEPTHLVIMTSRPGSILRSECNQLSQLGFSSFMMSHLSDAEAAEIIGRTLRRLGEPESRTASLSEELFQHNYYTLRAVPLLLTLLIHVMRKVHHQRGPAADGGTARAPEVLKKTEVYQRAIKLMLHQSDNAKFALREGSINTKQVQRLETLKGTGARKLLQTIAWHTHCRQSRIFTWSEVQDFCGDTQSLKALRSAFEEGRLSMFELVDNARGEPRLQFYHLSFQEMLVAEYAAAIVQTAHAQSLAPSYISMILSKSPKSLERERLSTEWWIQVWLHVCEMIHPDALDDWCQTLAQDEQAKVRVGGTWIAVDRMMGRMTMEIESMSGGFCKLKWNRQSCFQKYVSLEINEFTSKEMKHMPLTMVEVVHDGVGKLFRQATAANHRHIVRRLLDMKVHAGLVGENTAPWLESCQGPISPCLDIFAEYDVQWTDAPFVTGDAPMSVCYFMVKRLVRAAVLRGFSVASRAIRRLSRAPRNGVLEQARLGTLLSADGEFDPNFVDPETEMTPLMVAAGCGQVDVVRVLLEGRADVHAVDSGGCFPLTYAAECPNEGTEACMKLLIAAQADVHHCPKPIPDSPYHILPEPAPVARAVVIHGEENKFTALLEAGFDKNWHTERGNLLAHALMWECHVPLVKTLCSISAPAPTKWRGWRLRHGTALSFAWCMKRTTQEALDVGDTLLKEDPWGEFDFIRRPLYMRLNNVLFICMREFFPRLQQLLAMPCAKKIINSEKQFLPFLPLPFALVLVCRTTDPAIVVQFFDAGLDGASVAKRLRKIMKSKEAVPEWKFFLECYEDYVR